MTRVGIVIKIFDTKSWNRCVILVWTPREDLVSMVLEVEFSKIKSLRLAPWYVDIHIFCGSVALFHKGM